MSRAPLLVVVVAVAESRLAFHLASDMGCACLSLYLSVCVCVCAPSGMMTAYCECQWTSIASNFHVIVCCCCLTLLLKLLFESLLLSLSLSLLPLSSNWQAIFCPGCEYILMAICLLPVAESSQKLMQNTRKVSSAWAFRMNIRNRIRIVFEFLLVFVRRVTYIYFPDFP